MLVEGQVYRTIMNNKRLVLAMTHDYVWIMPVPHDSWQPLSYRRLELQKIVHDGYWVLDD